MLKESSALRNLFRPVSLRMSLVISLFLTGVVNGTETDAPGLDVFSSGSANIYLDAEKIDAFLAPAVEDFRRYFKVMTGADLPTEKHGNAIPIRFRITASPNDKLSKEQTAAWHDCKIFVEKSQIMLESTSSYGISNGLYKLLDKWGCRWIMPGAIGECIPKVTSLTLPYETIDQKLSTDMRIKVFHGGEEGRAWARRNQNRFGRYLPTDHNWATKARGTIVPEEIFNNPEKPETYHPEYYALIGGKRSPRQICTTNPGVIKRLGDAMDEYFTAFPDADSFSIDPNDNTDFCQCKTCVALDPAGTTPEGLPLMTDRIVTFANEASKIIRVKYPGKYVGFCAYNLHTLPPVNVKPEPEVIVCVTRMNYEQYRLTPRDENDSAAQFYKLVSDWVKLVSRVTTYEYTPLFWNANFFCPNYLDFAQTMKDTMKLGSRGTYTDGMIFYDNTTNFVTNYLYFRLSADITLDPKEELSRMSETFYGPAGKAMYDYYLTMAETTEIKMPANVLFSGGVRNYYELFTPDIIERAGTFLQTALSAVPNDDVYRKRVELAKLNQNYLNFYLDGVWKAKQKDYEGSMKAFDQLDEIVPKLGEAGLLMREHNVFGVEDTQERIRGVRLMVLADSFPEEFGMVTRWKLLGPFDNSLRDAEMKTDPFEPLNSIDTPVKTADGEKHEWKSTVSPSGFLNFKNSFGEVNPAWKAFYAYVGVEVNSPKKQWVELRMDSFQSFRVFLNGKDVFYRPGADNDLPDKRKVPVRLESGKNVIVIKCTHGGGDNYSFPSGLYFRITYPDGKLVKGLDYAP